MRNIASLFHPAFFVVQGGGEARMAELVDASDSKSGYRKVVQVRFLFRAQSLPNEVGRAFFYAVDELIRKKPIEPLILDLSICDSLFA